MVLRNKTSQISEILNGNTVKAFFFHYLLTSRGGFSTQQQYTIHDSDPLEVPQKEHIIDMYREHNRYVYRTHIDMYIENNVYQIVACRA